MKPKILTGLAKCYYGLQKYDKAMEAVEEGLENLADTEPPIAGELYTMKGHCLKKMRRFKEAIEAFLIGFNKPYKYYDYVHKSVCSVMVGHWYCQAIVNPTNKFYYFMGDYSWETRLITTHKCLMYNFDQNENKFYLKALHRKIKNPLFTREMVKCGQKEIMRFQNSAYITNFLRNAAF